MPHRCGCAEWLKPSSASSASGRLLRFVIRRMTVLNPSLYDRGDKAAADKVYEGMQPLSGLDIVR